MAKGAGGVFTVKVLTEAMKQIWEESDRMIYGIQPDQCRMFVLSDLALYKMDPRPRGSFSQSIGDHFPWPIFVFTSRDPVKDSWNIYLDPRRIHTFPGSPRGEGGELGD